jgi:hypothetical protein
MGPFGFNRAAHFRSDPSRASKSSLKWIRTLEGCRRPWKWQSSVSSHAYISIQGHSGGGDQHHRPNKLLTILFPYSEPDWTSPLVEISESVFLDFFSTIRPQSGRWVLPAIPKSRPSIARVPRSEHQPHLLVFEAIRKRCWDRLWTQIVQGERRSVLGLWRSDPTHGVTKGASRERLQG